MEDNILQVADRVKSWLLCNLSLGHLPKTTQSNYSSLLNIIRPLCYLSVSLSSDKILSWLINNQLLCIDGYDRVLYNESHPLFTTCMAGSSETHDALILHRISQYFNTVAIKNLPGTKKTLINTLTQLSMVKITVPAESVLMKLIELKCITICSDLSIIYFESPNPSPSVSNKRRDSCDSVESENVDEPLCKKRFVNNKIIFP